MSDELIWLNNEIEMTERRLGIQEGRLDAAEEELATQRMKASDLRAHLAMQQRARDAVLAARQSAAPTHTSDTEALAEFMKRPDAVKWERGMLPPQAETWIEVLLRTGETQQGQAQLFWWGVTGDAPGDIIAYRVVSNISENLTTTAASREENPETLTGAEPDLNPSDTASEGEGWTDIDPSVTGLVLKRDTEFMCDDGQIRQRRVDGEIGFLETNVQPYGPNDYRFVQMRDWKPALEWAEYRGLTPPTHYGYRLETKVDLDGTNLYRYVPTDHFIPHEPDEISLAGKSMDELNELFAGSGLQLQASDAPPQYGSITASELPSRLLIDDLAPAPEPAAPKYDAALHEENPDIEPDVIAADAEPGAVRETEASDV